MELLHLVRDAYDVERFECTDVVVIEEGAIPHSHPVLTLNTRRTTELEFLSTYLHEQFHWWSIDCPGGQDEREVAVMQELRRRYEPFSVGGPGECDTEFSALIHLHVCWLELEALATIVGAQRAIDCVLGINHYRSIYRIIVNDRDSLTDLFEQSSMGLPNNPQWTET